MENRQKPASQPPPKRVGVQEIAEALRISRGTVDRALHNRSGIHPSTKRRVLRAARRLGYKPNLAARYLSSRKHFTIGVSLPLGLVISTTTCEKAFSRPQALSSR